MSMKTMAILCLSLLILLIASPLRAKDAAPEAKLILEKPVEEGRRIVVPVTILSPQPLVAFSFEIHHDPSVLTVKSVANAGLITEDLEFFSARPEPKEGWVRVGGLTRFRLDKTLPPGELHVANVVFERTKGRTDREIELDLRKVELIDLDFTDFRIVKVNTMAFPVEIAPVSSNLVQNYPNPIRTSTTICYQLSKSTQTSLRIYNSAGQLVKTLIDCVEGPVHHSVLWDRSDESGRRVSSGVYFYQFRTDEDTRTRKLVVVE